jgi:type II secretory pathway component PulJ
MGFMQEETGASRCRRPQCGNGFTLVEVLAALTFLAVAGLAVMHANRSNMDTLTNAQRMDEAQVLARSVLFDLHREGVSDLMDRDGTFEEHPGFSWQARAFSMARPEGWYRLLVSVRWTDPTAAGDKVREVRVEEVLAK